MISVLIADDEKISRKILEKNIKNWGYRIHSAADGEEAWQIYKKFKIRIAILDWMMPKISGIDLCRKFRKEASITYTYIILLTSKDEKTDIIEGLSSGADDYITKPFDPMELKARLQTGKRIIDLETQLLKSQKKLHELATHDGLTGLLNRMAILQILKEEIERSKRDGHPLAVVMLDIDKFKSINDTYGHQAGDEVLIEVAQRLQKNIRAYDKFGRYGGDELLAVLPNCTKLNLQRIAMRLHGSISEKKIKTKKGSLDVTISIGGVSSQTMTKLDSSAIIRLSDEALYTAKEKGRNCFAISE
jgi:diguanylate cyclase (GGDEF)-like protein